METNAVNLTSCCRAVDAFLDAANAITSSLGVSDRQQRLFDALFAVVPCDAAVILSQTDGMLVPVAVKGLRPDVLGKPFRLADHPRLQTVLDATSPVAFDHDSVLPYPFDDWAPGSAAGHTELGMPLRIGNDVVGALLIHVSEADAIRRIAAKELSLFAALAAADLHVTELLDTLETLAKRRQKTQYPQITQKPLLQEGELLGQSPLMAQLRHEVDIVADADLIVLVTGETGTGKELVARRVHAQSSRRDKPLIYVNCAALPESIAESELFGHVKGAYTGADTNRVGKFELADGGTLFLDEIGELPLSVQPKLLRAIQSGEIQRLGSDRNAQVDVRIIAATNRNLTQEVDAGRFRIDLFHRVSVYPIVVPPLRDRGADIGVLADHFLDLACKRLGIGPLRLSTEALERLLCYHWPGNVRELDHVITRSALRAAERGNGHERLFVKEITEAHLDLGEQWMPRLPSPEAPVSRDEPMVSLKESVIRHKRKIIQEAVRRSGGNWAEAARRLKLHRSNLYRTAKQIGLNPSRSS